MFNFKINNCMKQFEVKALGLEEMSFDQAASVDGGFWVEAGILILIGLLVSCPTAARDNEEYYGGELDAAICEG